MKKIISTTILLAMLLGAFNILPVKASNDFVDLTKNATSAILMEASSGEILYNKNANKPVAVASLTKMMGLIIIFETIEQNGLKLDEILTTSQTAKDMGGSQIWLEVDEKISVKDLIKGIVMASANDAAVAIRKS